MQVVEMRGITKRFPPLTLAIDGVDFSAERGEIHCLLGENGAGKTTLMNILYGIYSADEGEILFEGQPIRIRSPRDAIDLGIGMVHQHFLQVQQNTVSENVALGLQCENKLFPLREVRRLISEVSTRYGLEVDPNARVWQLSAGEQQRVEIVKALCRETKVLILDEPTSILTLQEVETLFRALRQMVSEGRTIIFITHKLDEVTALSNRVSVLRKGRLVATLKTSSTTKGELARMMVGKEILFRLEKQVVDTGEVVLEVVGLRARDDRGLEALRGVSFKVRESEVLGIAGIAGNGQKELVEVLTGLRESSSGMVRLMGEDITNQPARSIADRGVAHIPEERVRRGLVPDMSVADNLILRSYGSPPYSGGFFLDKDSITRNAEALITKYGIVTPGPASPGKLLSGGNIQKLILARELSGDPRLVIAVHPTYGLDVGATEQIRELILGQRSRGAAVLLVSEDLDEVLTLSDRIAVIFEGQLVGIVNSAQAEAHEIGLMMAGEVVGECVEDQS
jgi:ABC-type uncharacterized transport system ATPase subunit